MSSTPATNLQGRSAFVTGAGSGIGASLVARLRHAGASVWAADIAPEGLARFASDPGVHPVPLDVSDGAAVRAMVDAIVREHGALDYAFNNAGVVVGGPTEGVSEAQWRRVVDVNLWGVIHGTQAAYEQMVRQGSGHIVNVASSAGAMAVAGSTPYAATKHAVVGLSASLRAEAKQARNGVRVSVVLPGLVDTNVFSSADTSAGYDYAAAIDRQGTFRKVSPDLAAEYILAGVRADLGEIVFPGYNQVLIRLYRLAPALMSRVVNMGYRAT